MHDAAGFFVGGDHGDTVGGRVGHGLFAIDVFAGADGVDDDLLVPMIGDGGDDAVNFFVVEELLIFARSFDFVADDFLCEGVAAVVKICGGGAVDSGEGQRVGEQAGALHADTDDAEADAIASGDGRFKSAGDVFRVDESIAGDGQGSGGASGFLQELTARGFHLVPPRRE